MAASISESYLSRAFTLGAQAGRELIFDIFDATDEDEAETILLATAPAAYQGLEIESVSAEHLGGNVWRGYSRYVRVENNDEYTFDTGNGTAKITQSLGTVGVYALSGTTAPDFNGTIGVNGDKIDGVEIQIPEPQFTETHYIDDSLVTSGYKRTLAGLAKKVNNATFKGMQAGEVLFLGATGSKRGDEKWQITYRFAYSPNVTGINLGGNVTGYYGGSGGGITVTSKLGWDYLWVNYADFEDATAFSLVKQPIAAYVERVYEFADFSALLIGT
jgi:hypothetical protein